jgi:hypothetical protein
MAEAWVVKGCGRWRIYADGQHPRLHYPEPKYILSDIHCPACWFAHIHRPKPRTENRKPRTENREP